MTTSIDPYVVFSDVDKSYDGKTKVVEGLNLEIVRNEFLTLLGPSGSGKTTTLMMLAGFETPTAGSILFDGKAITDVPTYKRNFGMVFQNYALFPHMTVVENLAFPLRMRKVSKSEIEERVKRTLDVVKLGEFSERKPGQLSGGQAQRVALARSIIFNPKMILMDEPLGALDKQLREQMQLEIKRLHHELNITMLYVTHDQTEALTMSDRVAVFNDGKIQQIGTPEEMYGAPVNKFVASFMGENNSLRAKVVRVESGNIVAVYLEQFDAEMLAKSSLPREVGQFVKVMVRPEHVRIANSGAPNAFSASITDRVYYGDHLRLVFDTRAEEMLTTRVQHHEVSENFVDGGKVHLTWKPEHANVFKA
jgi:putative spermidine/putrescine transport system ATP-binding protein